ncbi:MAG TPA: hypothetical protein PKB10_01250 [Tepidisphaeraceae bacterium]|nr:hypothetical protein [Tepidisphaeraceae bacterium]
MNPDQLEKLRLERPFQPFTMHLSDGTRYPVPSPEYVMHTKSGRSVAVLTGDGETFAIVDMLHVTQLTVGQQTELAAEEPRRRG